MLAEFTTFAFDGLRKGRRPKRRKGLRRPIRGTSRGTERKCGCSLTAIERPDGGLQPMITCTSTPMKRFVKQKDAAKYEGGTFCTQMPKPIRRRRRR